MQKLLTFLLLSCCFHCVSAQQFGGNPPSVEWMQINTDSLRVIFPKGTKEQALQVLNTSLYVNRNERYSIGNKVQKLNIILQPQTVISNGFVALGPFRSVFQTTPPANNFTLGTTNWLSELSIHETWHALQNMNFRTGIGKTFHTLFGGSGQSFITNLLIPDWYWEGDAVFMETHLTLQGRGRLSSFMEPFKSLYYSGKEYSYAKIRNGSLKDLVPDVYPLGYLMTAYGRNHYGYNFWPKVLQKTLLNQKAIHRQNKAHPEKPFHLFHYGFYPLSAALKYHTGKNIKGFYHAALSHFEKEWESEKQTLQPTPADTLRSIASPAVLNYRYPRIMEDGNILAVKNGYAQNPEIVQLNKNGKDKVIVRMGNTLHLYFSYGGHKIVWTEYHPDLRWGWKNYSVIRLHDLKTGRTRLLSYKSRYFSPALSADGKSLIAVEATANSKSRLVLLNPADGERLRVIPNPHNYFYTYPVFGDTKDIIIAGARDSLSNMALVRIDLRTGKQIPLTPFLPKSIGPPVNEPDYLYFPASYKKEIQLFALRKKDRQLFQIAQRPLGNYSMAVDTIHHRIVFDEYTAKGFQLLALEQNKNHWLKTDWDQVKTQYNPYVPKALAYGSTRSILEHIPPEDHKAEPYHALEHLFKVHSWSFLSIYPEISLYLQSRDLMGTLQVSAGGGYNLNEQTPFAGAMFLYGGLFPFIQAGFRKTFNRKGYVADTLRVKWDEINWYTGFQVPLNLSGGLYQRQLNLSGTFHQSALHFEETAHVKKQVKKVQYFSAGISFVNVRNQALQDINPKFGTSFSLEYNETLGNTDARQLTSNLNIFLPGLYNNHSLYFTTAYSEKTNSSQYKFSDDFSYAAGYHSIPYKQIYTLGANYQLPVAYSDWGLTWAYLLRIRLHLFYDYSRARMLPDPNAGTKTFRSAGASVYLDTKFFNVLNIPIGIRYTRLFDKDPESPGRKGHIAISFPVNLF